MGATARYLRAYMRARGGAQIVGPEDGLRQTLRVVGIGNATARVFGRAVRLPAPVRTAECVPRGYASKCSTAGWVFAIGRQTLPAEAMRM